MGEERSPFEIFVAEEIAKNGKEPHWARRCLELKQRADFLEDEDVYLRAERNKLQSQLAQTQEKLSEFESNYLDPKSYLNKLEEELSAAREVIKDWIEFEEEQIAKEGPYAGERINSLIIKGQDFMKQFGGKV